jgi:hypothetical protein
VAVLCTCVDTTDPVPSDTSGQWHYDGEDVVFQSFVEGTGQGGDITMHYCQDGDDLTLKYKGAAIQIDLSR